MNPVSWLALAMEHEFTQPRSHLIAQLCMSLTGCYLIKCGQATAARFMQWMGVYGKASDGGDISSWFVKPESAVLPHVDKVGLQDRVKRIEDKINVEDVEKILGYEFRCGESSCI